MKKKTSTETTKTRKAPKLSAKTKAKNSAIGTEIKRILEAGGTRTETVKKTVYKIDPKDAMKQAVKSYKNRF